VHREQDHMVIDSPLSSTQVTVHDPRVGALVLAFAIPRRFGDLPAICHGLSEAELHVLGTLLASCQILAETDDQGRVMSEEDEPLAYWEFHDLLFHARSRLGRHRMPYGPTFRLADRYEPLPATKAPMSEEAVDLYRPDLDQLLREDVPFSAVLEGRRSIRNFGDPLDVRKLGEFLYRTARQRKVFKADRGHEVSSRPYPGGGAIYELEIYLSVRSCLDLAHGFYHYCPREHRLFRIPSRPALVEALLQKAALLAQQPPQVLLTIAARFGRVFWKYESMGYALVLKDVGVLYQSMYLVAEAMGLGACALGAGNADLFAAAAGVDYYAESSVGELVIGSRSDANPV